MLECAACCLPLRTRFFTAPCGHALHGECAEALMVLDHKLRCPECQGTCEHADLWKTFWSADGNAEASETEEDGSLVRARRLLRLRMRLQRAEHEAAAAAKALTESRESGASCAHVEAELHRQTQAARAELDGCRARGAKLGAAASAASCFASLTGRAGGGAEQPADALIRALQTQHAGSLPQLFAVMQQLEACFAKQCARET